MKLSALTVAAAVALALPARRRRRQDLPPGHDPEERHSQVSVTLRKPAAFRILLRTSTQGRTRLYLLGAHAPRAARSSTRRRCSCEGTAGSFYCKGSYEPLPAGTYTFRIVYAGATPQPANVELTVRW